MFFLYFALLTCAVYLGVALVLEAGMWLVVYKTGGILVKYSVWFYGAVFAVVWLVSFSTAWRIYMHFVRAR